MFALVLYTADKKTAVVKKDQIKYHEGGQGLSVRHGRKYFPATILKDSDKKEWLEQLQVFEDGSMCLREQPKEKSEKSVAAKAIDKTGLNEKKDVARKLDLKVMQEVKSKVQTKKDETAELKRQQIKVAELMNKPSTSTDPNGMIYKATNSETANSELVQSKSVKSNTAKLGRKKSYGIKLRSTKGDEADSVNAKSEAVELIGLKSTGAELTKKTEFGRQKRDATDLNDDENKAEAFKVKKSKANDLKDNKRTNVELKSNATTTEGFESKEDEKDESRKKKSVAGGVICEQNKAGIRKSEKDEKSGSKGKQTETGGIGMKKSEPDELMDGKKFEKDGLKPTNNPVGEFKRNENKPGKLKSEKGGTDRLKGNTNETGKLISKNDEENAMKSKKGRACKLTNKEIQPEKLNNKDIQACKLLSKKSKAGEVESNNGRTDEPKKKKSDAGKLQSKKSEKSELEEKPGKLIRGRVKVTQVEVVNIDIHRKGNGNKQAAEERPKAVKASENTSGKRKCTNSATEQRQKKIKTDAEKTVEKKIRVEGNAIHEEEFQNVVNEVRIIESTGDLDGEQEKRRIDGDRGEDNNENLENEGNQLSKGSQGKKMDEKIQEDEEEENDNGKTPELEENRTLDEQRGNFEFDDDSRGLEHDEKDDEDNDSEYDRNSNLEGMQGNNGSNDDDDDDEENDRNNYSDEADEEIEQNNDSNDDDEENEQNNHSNEEKDGKSRIEGSDKIVHENGNKMLHQVVNTERDGNRYDDRSDSENGDASEISENNSDDESAQGSYHQIPTKKRTLSESDPDTESDESGDQSRSPEKRKHLSWLNILQQQLPPISADTVKCFKVFGDFLQAEYEQRARSNSTDFRLIPGPSNAPSLIGMSNLASDSKIELQRNSGIFIEKDDLENILEFDEKPRSMVRRLMKLIVGETKLIGMSAGGRSKRPGIPMKIREVVLRFVRRNKAKGTPKFTRSDYIRTLNLMCSTLRAQAKALLVSRAATIPDQP